MKIGLLTGEFPPQHGGVGDYTHELAQALAALGAEVHVITNHQSAVSRQPSAVSVHPVIHRWSFPALFQIRSITQSLNLQIINLQYQAAAYGLSAPIHFLPDVAGVKTVVTFHDLRIPYLFPKAGPLRPWTVTHLARSADGAIVTDPADELELHQRGGVKRLTQIPIGSNIAPNPPPGYDRATWRAQLDVQPDEFLIGYFGFLSESKGGDVLIGALAALAGRKARVKLVLIGGQSGSSDLANNDAFAIEIDKLIREYNVADRIIRTGFVESPQVSAHLLACDAMILPYRDGVSFRRGSLMAALAHGCPVVTTYPAMPLPVLQEGANIRLVPPGSASAIVLAVTELLDAPDLRARLGQGARDLARRFTWEAIAERTLEFFRAIVG
jgi:glycosyltransferase involved in cell wall biosynthesis